MEGKEDQAQLTYIDKSASFSKYDAVMIDSVTLWRSKATSEISAEDQQMLTDYLYKAIHDQLSKDFRIVDRPGPGVLRIRAAVTEAVGANVVTSVIPQARVLSTLGGLAADSAMMAGSAASAGESTESTCGLRPRARGGLGLGM